MSPLLHQVPIQTPVMSSITALTVNDKDDSPWKYLLISNNAQTKIQAVNETTALDLAGLTKQLDRCRTVF